MWRRTAFFIIGLLAFVAPPMAPARAAGEASRFIEQLGNQVLDIYRNAELSPAEQENRLYAIAVKSFDVPRIARSVLGRYWAQATPAERDEFIKVFQGYMVHVYAGRFSQYRNVRFRALRESSPAPSQTVVQTEIVRPGDPQPIRVDWLVGQDGGVFKIIDVNIEGVSQLLTLREEFATVLQRNDGRVSALTDQLRQKIGG
jgi:phospholipid transport system substrate-binding protein